jgi:hypothetical protein
MSSVARDGLTGAPMQGVFGISGTKQKVAAAGTSAQSAAVGATCNVVRLWASHDCHVEIGANPTALDGSNVAPSTPLTAKVEHFVSIQPGQKIAAIKVASGTDGILYITELD